MIPLMYYTQYTFIISGYLHQYKQGSLKLGMVHHPNTNPKPNNAKVPLNYPIYSCTNE